MVGHIAEFTDLISNIKPHVIALTETWLKPTHDDLIFNLKEYSIYRRDRNLVNPETGRLFMGGGIACLIHKSLKPKLLHNSCSNYISDPEYLLLDITSHMGGHLLFLVIYRRPRGNLLNELFDTFANLVTNYRNYIIAGDLNCDLLDSTYFSNHLKTHISELSLHCVPYGATHHTKSNDSWLDVVLLDSEDEQGKFFKSHQPFINGHDFLFCDNIFEVQKPLGKSVTYRKFSATNHNDLSKSLSSSLNIDRDPLNNSDPDYLLNLFQANVLASLDKYAPLKSRQITRTSHPWMTRELELKCKHRDALYKRAKKSNDIVTG